MLLDSHCHVNAIVYGSEQEVDAVIARAQEAGVQQMVTIGSGYGLETMGAAIHVAEQHHNIYASVGVHPHDASHWTEAVRNNLQRLASSSKVVALGEMGLDFYVERSSKEQQKVAFREQIDVAKLAGLPIVIHDRDSNGETLQILRQEEGTNNGFLFHCFCGTVKEMEQIVSLGGYVSLPGIVTFSNAEQMRAVAAKVPIDRLLVETDSPFLTPVPLRGRRNEPKNLPFVVSRIAQIRGVEYSTIAAQTRENALRFFRLNDKNPVHCVGVD